jgi:GNAT superfamily N-acetyltransferase
MIIRSLKPQELELLYAHSRLEEWDIEEEYIHSSHTTSPEDFFIAYEDEKLVGFIIASKQSEDFGLINSFLVVKSLRGLGYGKKLFNHALEYLQGCKIAVDSPKSNKIFYENLGFVSHFDIITYQYKLDKTYMPPSFYIDVIDFDEKLSLAGQDEEMKVLILSDGTKYKAIQKENFISSFALMVKYSDGYKIHVESQDLKETISLYFALTEHLENDSNIYIQITDLSPMLQDFVQLLNMREDSRLTRMYRD